MISLVSFDRCIVCSSLIMASDYLIGILATGVWFSLVSFTNITDRHDIVKILLKVALNTLTLSLTPYKITTPQDVK
jgi:hypothetical protein